MQNKCSALNADLYHANVIVNYNCLCGYFNENAEHYLLHGNIFTLWRKVRHQSIINLLHVTNMTNLQTFIITT
jgi:hypothetical protein